MAFGPGLHAFPGGRVDPGDAGGTTADGLTAEGAATALGHNVAPDEALALHLAATREVFEEVGVRLRPTDLAPLAHWTTPRFMPRRFSTWFFVADLPNGVEPAFSPGEVASHRWVGPRAALDLMAGGEVEMWVPTTSVLQRLIETGARTAAEVRDRLRVARVPATRVVSEDDARLVFEFGSVGALPGRVGRTTLLGRRDVVVIDPGDPTDEATQTILAAAERRQAAIRAIVLTRTGPDHAAGAEPLAIPLEVPVLVAPGAGHHLPYKVRELADGERLPADRDHRVSLGPPGSGQLEILDRSARE